MSRPPRESLDYDTWLWNRVALTGDDEDESDVPARGDDRDEPDDFD